MRRQLLFPLLTTTRSQLFLNWRAHRKPASKGLTASWFTVILFLSFALYPCPSHAGTPSEIEHLLEYIQTSDCTFNRNGNLHNGQNASEHIRKKYAHTKRWIKSAEDFIRYAATESSMSGRPYRVICSGAEMPTARWLTDELERFRRRAQ